MSTFNKFIRDESGATAIEYGLIAAGIAAVIIATVNTLGGKVNTAFKAVSDGMAGGGGAAPTP